MERDFMGLNSKESSAVVKEEVNSDGYKEIGIRFLLSLSFLFLPWIFSNFVVWFMQFMLLFSLVWKFCNFAFEIWYGVWILIFAYNLLILCAKQAKLWYLNSTNGEKKENRMRRNCLLIFCNYLFSLFWKKKLHV